MKIIVKNMHCARCEARIKEALAKENLAAQVDLDEKMVEFSDPDISQKILEVLDSLGFNGKIKK